MSIGARFGRREKSREKYLILKEKGICCSCKSRKADREGKVSCSYCANKLKERYLQKKVIGKKRRSEL